MTDSLRYEVAKAIALDTAAYSRPEPSDYSLADTVLATVRRHVEALPELHCDSDDTQVLRRRDVQRLLGGGGDE